MKIHLVAYASPNMLRSLELCEKSARSNGVDEASVWTREKLKRTAFYSQNKSLLDRERGSGYWAWKPYIVYDELTDWCDAGDIVIYADAGVEFIADVYSVVDRMQQDVFLFGNNWPHKFWCKRDIVEAITPGEPWSSFGNQVQASVIFFRVSDFSKGFVATWLDYCTRVKLIDDSASRYPNDPEFRENRHDQAILTTLAYRDELRLHWWPAVYNGGAFTYEKNGYSDSYPPLFHHHRRRNDEYE